MPLRVKHQRRQQQPQKHCVYSSYYLCFLFIIPQTDPDLAISALLCTTILSSTYYTSIINSHIIVKVSKLQPKLKISSKVTQFNSMKEISNTIKVLNNPKCKIQIVQILSILTHK